MADTDGQARADQDISNLTDVFEHKIHLLSSTLEAVGSKCHLLGTRLVTAEEESKAFAERFYDAESKAERLRSQQESVKEREQMLRHEVMRLEALLEAERMQAGFTERKLQQMLGQEHLRSQHMRALRDSAILQRDDAMSELATAYADMDAMQATLADSAVYVRYMRKRVLELELEQTRNAAKSMLGQQAAAAAPSQEDIFSLASIKVAIQKAVQEAAACDEEEKRKRIKQLKLRWHPDKNPVLAELATEVTKLINEALAKQP